ncbi:MAG TPA: TetR/AcrR family transcriptional regulator [Actinomycetota bacterium]|nr:TetR/AcrR family transcriptional regulator [Actinomycetota bacterium]
MRAATAPARRRTQADRRARTRDALLEAAARGLSRHGYGNLVLERVASEAGYSRGALYHLFSNKEDLALAVVAWVEETWYAEMGPLMTGDDPLAALVAVVRGHAVYCRRDVARVMMTLRVEFGDRDHPVGRAVNRAVTRVVRDCTTLVAAARKSGAIPPGPPPKVLGLALVTAVEGLVIGLAGNAPFDEMLAERVLRGVLGLPPREDA